MNQEVKNKISQKNKGINSNTIFVNDGKIVKRVKKEDIDYYVSIGFKIGRKCESVKFNPWNKGLTKETDKRIESYINKRTRNKL